jgi:hypothetical protein
MATSTLVQDLNTGRDIDVSARREVQAFLPHAAIAAGDFVSLRTAESTDGNKALKVLKAVTGGSPTAGTIGPAACIIGVALNTVTAADVTAGVPVNVCTSGVCEANVDSATAVGSLLCAGVTAGRADVYEVTFLNIPVAMACEADSTNVATVIMFKQI